MREVFLGLDQGTTGTAALLFDGAFRVIAEAHVKHRQFYPAPGLVEHDPLELWECSCRAVSLALAKAGLSAGEITAVGLANQGETVVVWDKETGKPVYPAIVWSDRRTAEEAARLGALHGIKIRERTGLIADAYFSATKIRWILDRMPGVREKAAEGKVAAGTVDSWLIWQMTGGKVFATDPSTASRTMLYDFRRGIWDPEILSWLDIPETVLPEIRPTAGVFGLTDPEAFLGARIPVSGSAVDQQAALFGKGCRKEGETKATYGTGCFILMNTGHRPVLPEAGVLSTVAWQLPGEAPVYALDAGIYSCGSAIDWLRDGLGILRDPAETEAMARSVPDNGGVVFVPAFSGLAAPYWDPDARGTILGLTGGSRKEHIVRAALESIACQVKDDLALLEREGGVRLKRLKADGGLTANGFLMQLQADLLGIPVEVPACRETTALGAAQLAATGCGYARSPEELPPGPDGKTVYEPKGSPEDTEKLMETWHRAVGRAGGWAKTAEGKETC